MNKIKDNIIQPSDGEIEDMSTELFDMKLSSVKNEDELERFILDNTDISDNVYQQ